jgi:hypothetical protein
MLTAAIWPTATASVPMSLVRSIPLSASAVCMKPSAMCMEPPLHDPNALSMSSATMPAMSTPLAM